MHLTPMNKKTTTAIIAVTFLFSMAFVLPPVFIVDEEVPVTEVLQQLGDEAPAHQVNTDIPGVSAERGYNIVHTGFAQKPKGGKTKIQSKHFVCTSCHNVQRENPDLSQYDPQARLLYAKENGLPFLQGTTLYGAVNRTTFYNGDYEQKYGDLVKPARNNLREAIQLCAIECSQGRRLKDWELESVLAYLWTIQLKMGDLSLSAADYEAINSAINKDAEKAQAIKKIKAAYLSGSPATFVKPPEDRKLGYPQIVGDPTNGQLIYELSCLHCHEKGRYAFFKLDDSKYSFNYLEKHLARYTRYSLYQVARYGTSPMNLKRTYMPNYTLEKMSHQQLEDLRAYIEQEAKK